MRHHSARLRLGALSLLLTSSAPALAADPLDLGTGPIPAEIAQQLWKSELTRAPAASLEVWATHADPRVRARAARALGRVKDNAGARLLRPLLQDLSPEVRREAAWAFGRLSGEGGDVSRLLERWKSEPDTEVRAALTEALGRRGGPDTVEAFLGTLSATGERAAEDRRPVVTALGRMAMRGSAAARAPRVAVALLDVAEGKGWRAWLPTASGLEARRRAAWALGRSGMATAAPEVIARLEALVRRGGDVHVRAHALRAWAPLATASARGAVARDLLHETEELRLALVRMIAKLPVEGAEALLPTLLRDSEPGIRREAIAATVTVKPKDSGVLLAAAWTSADPWERAAATRALGALGALPTRATDLLGESFPIPVRMAAASLLQERSRLRELALRAQEPPLRSAATERLLALETRDLGDVLALLEASDATVAQAAAEALVETPEPAAERPLLTCLAREAGPELAVACLRALDALWASGRLTRPGPSTAKIVAPLLRLPQLGDMRDRLAELLEIDPPAAKSSLPELPALEEVLRIRGARVRTDQGELRLDFHTEDAPYTVWNFARLAERDVYDGLRFHRVVPGFVAQSGDPRGDGWGGPGYSIPDELNAHGYGRGAVGMALSGPDTGGSQWFVTLEDHPHLDGDYTCFGQLSAGDRAAASLREESRILDVIIERAP
jgi:cyclophilin family peptidyl-prolyl cis-trans isomerase/HEAT repeat protein